MKYVAHCQGVPVPAGQVVHASAGMHLQAEELVKDIGFPLFVKPAKAGDSLGIDAHSLVRNSEELASKLQTLSLEYSEIMVEQYIEGREFTVLVSAGETEQDCTVYRPLEYCFPPDRWFKTYAMKTSELHANCNVPCSDPVLDAQLQKAAEKIFRGFRGVGYARMDFRVDSQGRIYFLELNFTCSVFYEDGYEGSADHILNNDEHGKRGFLLNIIREGGLSGIQTEAGDCVGSALSGYGIYATRSIAESEIIFRGEERAQRIARTMDEKNIGMKTHDVTFVATLILSPPKSTSSGTRILPLGRHKIIAATQIRTLMD